MMILKVKVQNKMTTLLVKITHHSTYFGESKSSAPVHPIIKELPENVLNTITTRNIEIISTTKSKETLVQELWTQRFTEIEKFNFEEYNYNHSEIPFEEFQKLCLEEKVKGMESADKEYYLDRVNAYTQLRDAWLKFKFTTYDQDKLTMPNTLKLTLKAELYEEDDYINSHGDDLYLVKNGYLIYMEIGTCYVFLV